MRSAIERPVTVSHKSELGINKKRLSNLMAEEAFQGAELSTVSVSVLDSGRPFSVQSRTTTNSWRKTGARRS
jgi:hypothetical protein